MIHPGTGIPTIRATYTHGDARFVRLHEPKSTDSAAQSIRGKMPVMCRLPVGGVRGQPPTPTPPFPILLLAVRFSIWHLSSQLHTPPPPYVSLGGRIVLSISLTSGPPA